MASCSSLAIRKNFCCKLFNIKISIIKPLWEYWHFPKVYMRKFFNFRESFAVKGVIMKMFANKCIDLIFITYDLSKTVLNCLVVIKISFWQYDSLLIFPKVLKVYGIIIFVNIQNLIQHASLIMLLFDPILGILTFSFW